MAEINGGIFGRLSGSLGDIAFRQRNGKTYICRRTKSFVPGHDKESVGRRTRFALAGKLARAIYSIPELLALWRRVTPKGKSPFNIMVQNNIKVVNADSVSDITTITPGIGFKIYCTSSSISNDAVIVELGVLGESTGIDVTKEPDVKLAFVLSLTNPVNASFPTLSFVTGTSDLQPIVLDAPLTFNIRLTGSGLANAASYRDKKLLFTLLTMPAPSGDASGNPVGYSGTVVK